MSIQTYNNIFDTPDIDYILNLPEVNDAKNRINSVIKGQQYFNINIPIGIQQRLQSVFNVNLTQVPMRWIKGDTPSHIDKGKQQFEKTYLVYLTDSVGSFNIDHNNYPIVQNTGFKFEEGIEHSVTNTDSVPRLLMGPMDEKGSSVGGPLNFNYPGGTTVYLRDTAGFYEYSLDQTIWNNFYFPVEVTNTDTSLGLVTIEFTTDFTFFNNDNYFICSSSHIQFGSKSLRNDGTRPQITIDGVTDYSGLIQNGNFLANGYSNIYIFNLVVLAINGSTIYSSGIDSAGWLGQDHFGKAATNNYIINCSSDGPMSEDCGGIVGANSGSGLGAVLTIIGCSSSGIIEEGAGGIVGTNAGINSGSVICTSCWSTGLIQERSGGIFSIDAGRFTGYVEAKNCYSTGSINFEGGGIFGFEAGNNNGTVVAENCYSLGDINTNAGGIFGTFAARNSGSTNAINCYSNGVVNTSGNGIYGTNKQAGAQTTNCYIANNSWNNTTANSSLTGTPNPILGTTWVYNGVNEPYELYNMGYTPYTIAIINSSGTDFVDDFTETINPNTSSVAAVISGRTYTIAGISGGDPASYSTFSINATTGVVTTTSSTVPGNYTIYVRNTGSYNYSSFVLTISGSGPIPCLVEGTTVLTPKGYIQVESLSVGDKVLTSDKRDVYITNIFTTVSKCNIDNYPCIIPKNSIGSSYPKQEFRISQDHLIKYGDYWILPKLVFSLDKTCKQVKYYHIQLEDYEKDNLIVENGTVVESYGSTDSDNNERLNRIQNTMRAFFTHMKNGVYDKYIFIDNLFKRSYMNLVNSGSNIVWSENLRYFALGLPGNYPKVNNIK